MAPVEILIPSFRVFHFSKKENEEELRTNLDLIEELREQAQVRMATYQQRIAKYYKARLRFGNWIDQSSKPESSGLRQRVKPLSSIDEISSRIFSL